MSQQYLKKPTTIKNAPKAAYKVHLLTKFIFVNLKSYLE